MHTVSRFRLLFQVGVVFLCLSVASLSAAGQKAPEKIASLQDIAPDQAAETLAQLSDTQVRQLVLAGIGQQAATVPTAAPPRGLVSGLRSVLRGLNEQDDSAGIAQMAASFPGLPRQLMTSIAGVGEGKPATLLLYLAVLVFVFALGWAAEWFVRRQIGMGRAGLVEQRADMHPAALNTAVLQPLVTLAGIAVFGVASLLIFLVIDIDSNPFRMAFMAILLAIVLARGLSLIAYLLFWPGHASLRLMPLADLPATAVYQETRVVLWYLAGSLTFIAFFLESGAPQQSALALGTVLGTLLFVLIIARLFARKSEINQAILRPVGEVDGAARGRFQLAAYWPFFAVFYLFVVWLVWVSAFATDTISHTGALIISLLIFPIYLLLERVGQWLVANVMAVIGLQKGGDQPGQTAAEPAAEPQPADWEQRERSLRAMMIAAYRIFVALVLIVWLMYLWGVEIPYAAIIVKAVFQVIITLTLALLLWRFVSRYIERKLKEVMPEPAEVKEHADDEFGGAAQLGRSYTLLPILRKFAAVTLFIMTSMTIISALGVHIAPLLAGAGVVGLAIGFGAQKMVSDVLSGIFYLFDDAFRVGEYIQAGGQVGTVEAITLRNVMLRHHRGMLQIVPHSDLGGITNFMRGGIIVKFNLEFPYDADVDQIRKIIKKVGQAMLEDPELGPGFILPVKSQGVYEITNSVMVIRVKFTARPGRQFLIRREAYRLITEALAAKGIHYAHRRVIVEVPQAETRSLTPQEVQRLAEAGAAAGMLNAAADEKAAAEAKAASENDAF
jgi:small-conductance mechanosensitive channel